MAPADVLAFWFGAEGLSRRELLSTQEYCDKQARGQRLQGPRRASHRAAAGTPHDDAALAARRRR